MKGSIEPESVPQSTMPTREQADGERDQQPVRAVDVENADQSAIRRKPMVAEDDAERGGPDRISRRITRHQSRGSTSPRARARMIEGRRLGARVAAAGDDERHEQGEHHRLARSPSRSSPSRWR